MGASFCTNVSQDQGFPDTDIQPLLQLSDHDGPLPSFAKMENVKYQVPCKINHILTDIPEMRYEADLQRGTKIDNSYYLIPFSVYYTGEWKNGVPHGIGDVVFQNGSVLKGTFYKGKVKGYDCILVMEDGSYYRGNIQNNSFCGKGLFAELNGHVFQGHWENSVPHGIGEEKFANGDVFIGDYFNGRKEGEKCVYRWAKHPEYKEYRGCFKNDQMSGEGELIRKNGRVTGIFRNFDIEDANYKSDKFEYQGQIINGVINGDGKITYRTQGIIYEGKFQNGQPHGTGTMTMADGSKKTGRWFKGNLLKEEKGLIDDEIEACLEMVNYETQNKHSLQQAVSGMNKRLVEAGYENFTAQFLQNQDSSEKKGTKYLMLELGPQTLLITTK